jgi:hypothetical protein
VSAKRSLALQCTIATIPDGDDPCSVCSSFSSFPVCIARQIIDTVTVALISVVYAMLNAQSSGIEVSTQHADMQQIRCAGSWPGTAAVAQQSHWLVSTMVLCLAASRGAAACL